MSAAVERTPGLDRAVELEGTAWRLWQAAAGEVTLAGRSTVGDGAAVWALGQLELWAETLTLVDLDALADALVAEAEKIRAVAA